MAFKKIEMQNYRATDYTRLTMRRRCRQRCVVAARICPSTTTTTTTALFHILAASTTLFVVIVVASLWLSPPPSMSMQVVVAVNASSRGENTLLSSDNRSTPSSSALSDAEKGDEPSSPQRQRVDALRAADADIRNTWHTDILQLCVDGGAAVAAGNFSAAMREWWGRRVERVDDDIAVQYDARAESMPSNSGDDGARCYTMMLGYERVAVEIVSRRRPPILKLSRVLDERYLHRVEEYYATSSQTHAVGVNHPGFDAPGKRVRRADGLWLNHDNNIVQPLFRRIRALTRVNPALGEHFLILNYPTFGHYTPHYDHLKPLPDEFAYVGNRLATALLIVRTAASGGGTAFPRLARTIMPERGDLLLWLNTDSNQEREEDSLHAACPIESGEKMAVTLWIHANHQHQLRCALADASGYEARELVRDSLIELGEIPREFRQRPVREPEIFR